MLIHGIVHQLTVCVFLCLNHCNISSLCCFYHWNKCSQCTFLPSTDTMNFTNPQLTLSTMLWQSYAYDLVGLGTKTLGEGKIKFIFWHEIPVLVALNTAGNDLEVLLKIHTDTHISHLLMLKQSGAAVSVLTASVLLITPVPDMKVRSSTQAIR